MLQGIIDKLYARFVEVVFTNRQKLLTQPEVKTLADYFNAAGYHTGEALAVKLIDRVSYLDGAIDEMKKELGIDQAQVVTYIRPRTFKSNIYSGYSEQPLQGSQVVNLISVNAEELSLFSGVQFMYLWNP